MCALPIVTGNGLNGLGVDGGTLTKNGFWDDSDIVYITRGDITVPVGMHLTVGAGQIIKFGNYTYDIVKIGRASCRERVEIAVVAVSLKKKRAAHTLGHTTEAIP